jgi:hypothetical protein
LSGCLGGVVKWLKNGYFSQAPPLAQGGGKISYLFALPQRRTPADVEI